MLKTPKGYRTLSPGAVAERYGVAGYGYAYEPLDYDGEEPYSPGYDTLQDARQADYRDRNGRR